MALLDTPICDFGRPAEAFSLSDPDGETHTLSSVMGPNGLLVAFLCNHCPYVQAIADRLAEDTAALKAIGVHTVAIMSNDIAIVPTDGPPFMKAFAARHGWEFPYLFDEDQSVGQVYGAVCTPDFFGYNAQAKLQYRGRLDDASMGNSAGRTRELVAAMTQVAQTGEGPQDQKPSMGCSIKWR